jgi:hypothetical protein
MSRILAVPLADYERALGRADTAEAKLEHALDALSRLVRQLERVGGYAKHEDQAELQEARAVLAEER